MAKEKINIRAYYKGVFGRARSDTWRLVGTHLVVTSAVLVATYGLGVVLGTRLDGGTLTIYLLIPLAALGVVALGVFAVAFARAPVLLGQDAAKCADSERQRLDEANRAIAVQLQQATERAEALEAEPVSREHQRVLQDVAKTLLSGVRVLARASYLRSHAPSANPAYGFREHFSSEASALDDWNARVADLRDKRGEFRESLVPKLAALGDRLGVPLGGSLETGIARAAEQDEPQIQFAAVAGYLQMGSYVATGLGLGEFDRAGVESSLREILTEATVSHECTLIVNARHDLEDLRDPLAKRLSIIAERDSIPRGGGCRLC